MHSDIPQAFIQSMLDSDSSWMTLPKGVSLLDTKGNPHTLVKLMKALYGLKQSPQLWSKTLGNFFRDEGKLTHYAAGEIRSYTLYFPMHRIPTVPIIADKPESALYKFGPPLSARDSQATRLVGGAPGGGEIPRNSGYLGHVRHRLL